ncbi:phosphoribosyltransferase family protein [Flavobacteriaceae bacterium]|nr:phosphoribosyltransferase family protein [Flavobacteriaceae bacterium]
MLSQLVNLFFPKTCQACNHVLTDYETHICVKCRHELPLTNYHYERPKVVKKIFYGRVELEAATALFYFHKEGLVQHLLHKLKYKGQEQLGQVFGVWLGAELQESSYFKSIDVVIPVPVHSKKLKQRGYNQVALFAKHLAKSLNAYYDDSVLLKSMNTKTQVFQSREERFQSVANTFYAKNLSRIDGKHVLLVDDVITTGATIEACALVLNSVAKIRLSLATIAITHSIFR